MNFAQQQALYFILPVTLAVLGLALYARAKRHQAAAAFVAGAMAPRILPAESSTRFWLKLFLLEAGFVCALIALARPQWGEVVEEIKIKGSDLYVLIDVSRSMLAKDVPPSRLERAKSDVSGLLNKLKGERIGLIAFAGSTSIKVPLTSDYDYFRAALKDLSPNSVDRGGTAIGDAIRKALSVLPVDADRDQALLLITDGDDQESQPEIAAALAVERHVIVFTVGLGDPNEGASVPDKEGKVMQYDGKNVVSKLSDELLRKIALDTGGAYVPARTSAYDLGKLYEEKLSQLRGEYVKEQKRRRMEERFEIPLFFAVLCFILEILILPYRPKPFVGAVKASGKSPRSKSTPVAKAALLGLCLLGVNAYSADAQSLVNEGINLYKKQDYAAAGEKFSEAEKAAPKDIQDDAARAAFNAGCAYQRKGDAEKAKEAYLKAALARDKALSTSANFNLGNLATEGAKTLAGEKPDEVPQEKRQEILDKLKTAVGHYRSCLDVNPNHEGARQNLELVRLWIKSTVNKWAEYDRIKRRNQLQLPEYLDWMAQSQKALAKATKSVNEYASADEFYDLKRAQDELIEEIEPLKDKIKRVLNANNQPAPNQLMAQQPQPPQQDPKEIELAIKTLSAWADEAGASMKSASNKLSASKGPEAATLQKDAVDPLMRSWEAIAPFGAMLQRDFDEQSKIVDTLKPPEPEPEKKEESKDTKDAKKEEKAAEKKAPEPPRQLTKDEFEELAELQNDVKRRTELLVPKAKQTLEQMEKSEAKDQGGAQDPNAKKPAEEKKWLSIEDVEKEEAIKKAKEAEERRKAAKPNGADKDTKAEEKKDDAPPTPEEIKKGLQKAIELAPKAAEKMTAALEHLRKSDRDSAIPEAEEAKRILKEIVDAQPKQKNKEQEKKEDKKDQQKQDQQDKKDEQKKEDEKKDGKDKQDKDKNKDKKDQQEQKGKAEKHALTKEQADALLRKVRERELDHKKQKSDERDALQGRMSGVEKDW